MTAVVVTCPAHCCTRPAAYGEVGLEEPDGNNDDVFENPGLGKGEFAKHRIYLLSNPEQATARAVDPGTLNRRRKWHGKENQNESENV